MDELRETIAAVLQQEAMVSGSGSDAEIDNPDHLAARILAIPELQRALATQADFDRMAKLVGHSTTNSRQGR